MQVGAAADLAQVARVGERGGDGDRVGGLAVGELVGDGVEDDAVAGLVEVARLEGLDDVGDGVLAHEHAAEHGLLGRQVLGRGALVGAGAAEGVLGRGPVEVGAAGGLRAVRAAPVAALGGHVGHFATPSVAVRSWRIYRSGTTPSGLNDAMRSTSPLQTVLWTSCGQACG